MDSKKGFIVLLGVLLLAMTLLGFRTYSLSAEKAAMAHKSELLEEELRDFGILKTYLLNQVDSLRHSYDGLVQENANLHGESAEAQRKLAEKDAIISKLKAKGTSEKGVNNLKSQIEQLLNLKATLEITIADLRSENEQLRTANFQLSTDLASVRTENVTLANLNRSIQEEMKRLTLANFKATAFRVEVEKRSPKLTVNAKRAKKILVSFDLMKVAPEHRSVKPLYLVLTDDKGTPVKIAKPISAKINVNGQEMDIQAAKEQKVSIAENQRLAFGHELDEKLRSGYYRVAVYTDNGLLGAASFRLQ